ncbi:MAG: glycosyltransferase family 4 protein [Butyrivibrio sp.]|nr:glycosyltransferase family 4 protein [Butyrivibrio sp.]
MLGHKRVPSREGGVEVVVEELSTRMIEQGHKVTLFNRKGHHVAGEEFDQKPLDEYKGVKLVYVPTINKRGLAAATSSYYGALKAAFGPYDVVHFHAEGPCVAIWVPKLVGKRCIVTIHGLDHMRKKWGSFASKYILLGEKRAVKYADEIIVLSKNVQEYFKTTYGRKTIFIPNGVSRPELQEPDIIKEKYNLKKDNYFMFLGRLVPEKGIEYLIKAYKGLNTDKKLVIAGSGSDTEEFVNEIHKLTANDDRIIFTGFVQGKELAELFSNCYTFVLPSDLEGMPMTLLEAMSYGRCCLVSDIPECASVVEDKAETFKAADVEDLRKKMQRLNDDKDLAHEYQKNAADYICNKYSWDKVVQETLEIYHESSNS